MLQAAGFRPVVRKVPGTVPAGMSSPEGVRFGASEKPGARIARPEYVYHFTTARAWEKIQSSGGLRPRLYKEPGNFVLSWENLTRDWTRETRYFGSCLQAWIGNMRANLSKLPAGQDKDILLLRIRVEPTDQLWARDVGPVFNSLNLRRWHESLAPLSEFRPAPAAVPELIIADPVHGEIPVSRIEVFRRIPLAIVPPEILEKKMPPKLVLDHILSPERGPIPVAPDAEPMRFKRTMLLGIVFNLRNALWHYYQMARSKRGQGAPNPEAP